jgi:EAL domain-containing protein (putative c-di-GMP-specific phosphodiesterase class I)
MPIIDFLRFVLAGFGILSGLFLITNMIHNYLEYSPKKRDLVVGFFLGGACFLLNFHIFFVNGIAVLNLKFMLLLFLTLMFSWRSLVAFAPFYLLSVYFSPFSLWYALALLAIAGAFLFSKLAKELMAGLLFFSFVPVVFSEIYINGYLGRFDSEVFLTAAVSVAILGLVLTLTLAAFLPQNLLGSVFLSRYFLELFSKFDNLYIFYVDINKGKVHFSRKCAEDFELPLMIMPLDQFQQLLHDATETHVRVTNQKIERTLFSTPATGQEIFIEYFAYRRLFGDYVGVIRDITKQTSRTEVLYRAKARDYVTGFPGYPVMKEGILDYCKVSTEFMLFASLRLNLDFQKSTVYETEFELACYKLIANVLRKEFPEAEIYSVKTGELLFAFQENPKEGQEHKALRKLVELFSAAYTIQEKQFVMKAKIGALYIESLRVQSLGDVDEILKKLTFCKYMTDSQDNCDLYMFVPGQYEEYNQRLLRLRYLPGILKRGDFSLVFQPILDVRSGETLFIEALLRVHNEVYSNTGEFVGDCVVSGLDVELDRMIFTKIHALALAGVIPSDISVNILGNTPILDEMKNLSNVLNSQGKTLYIELTEHIYNSPHEVMVKAEQLKRLGIKIIADDYGTGFSNNIMLAQVKFDGLKIPIELMSNILSDEKAFYMIKSIRDYCENLKILCVAEGIETEEQVRSLHTIGINLGQGYHLAMPQSLESLSIRSRAGEL